ncbi:hypothetical protein RKD35_002330 [Streptomyces albogriseolus]
MTNSEGWREKPPGSLIQEWAPLIVEPSGVSTSRIRNTEAPYSRGTAVRSPRWPSQRAPIIRATPMPVFSQCRTRK